MSDRRLPELTEADLRTIVHESMQSALTTLGVEVDEPIEMQADFHYLREWRLTVQAVRSRGLKTVVVVIVSGLLAVVWAGLTRLFHH